MSRTWSSGTRFLALAIVMFVANCAVVVIALGQATVAAVPGECSAYEAVPLPAEALEAAVPKAFPVCASYRSYRGIGRPVNWLEARGCAWQERLAQKAGLGQSQEEPTAWVVGGSLILADIYANGAGVKPDMPLAFRFACEVEERMANLALEEIAKAGGRQRSRKPFEFCDYAATTFSMNFCAEYEQEIRDDRRSRYYSSLSSAMSGSQRAAFGELLAAQKAYVEAHAAEVYQGGTMRGIRTIGSQGILNENFRMELGNFEHKRWPRLSGNQVATAAAGLDREYEMKVRQIRARSQEDLADGAVTAGDFSSVEEAWKRYRDAWVGFAALRYPGKVAIIRAEITLDRYRLVKTIS